MKRHPSNYLLLWLRDGLSCLAITLSSASVLQAFFLKMGMESGTVSYYTSFTQATAHAMCAATARSGFTIATKLTPLARIAVISEWRQKLHIV